MLCFVLMLSCPKMGARLSLDLILPQNGLILHQNVFQVIINDDLLEERECYVQ